MINEEIEIEKKTITKIRNQMKTLELRTIRGSAKHTHTRGEHTHTHMRI